MDDRNGGHGSYVRQVLDGSRRYTEDLLEKNKELRAAQAQLQVEQQSLREQLSAAQSAVGHAHQLKAQLLASEQQAQALREQLAEARTVIAAHERDRERLDVMLAKVDEENRRSTDEFAQLQQQANNLANLYVAMYRLHEALELGQLVVAVTEIVANLIGSEEMAFFELDADKSELVLIGSNGVDPASYRRLPLDRGLIGAAVRGGVPLVVVPGGAHSRAQGEEHLSAVIPLRFLDGVNGAIAIFRLLTQKAAIQDLDRELFDLLASTAGIALHCANLHTRFGASAVANGH